MTKQIDSNLLDYKNFFLEKLLIFQRHYTLLIIIIIIKMIKPIKLYDIIRKESLASYKSNLLWTFISTS